MPPPSSLETYPEGNEEHPHTTFCNIIAGMKKFIVISSNIDMDKEDRDRYERALRKKERKEFQKTENVILEELVPKATGKCTIL